MSDVPELRTERLLLREWSDEDLDPFAALNADPEVMRFMPKLLSRDECAAQIQSIREHFRDHGFGLWAVEVRNVCPFVGFVGLNIPRFEAPFMPCVEIGWRLAHTHWHLDARSLARRISRPIPVPNVQTVCQKGPSLYLRFFFNCVLHPGIA